MDKITVVVKEGAVDAVFGTFAPGKVHVEVLDMDTTDPELESMLMDEENRLQQYLTKLL